jgi:hypothetical protein
MSRRKWAAVAAAGLMIASFGPVRASAAEAGPGRTTALAGAVVSASTPRQIMVNWANTELNNDSHNQASDQGVVYNCNYYTGHFQGHQSGCQSGWHGGDWCADFVHYIWQLAGDVADLSQVDARAESFKEYGINHGSWHTRSSGYTPAPGDAIVYTDGNNTPGADHVGIVVSASASSVITIEGNTGSEATHKYTVSRSSAKVQGFTAPVIDQPAGAIENNSDLGLGVIHLADGNYGHGAYDVALPAHEDTYHSFGWAEAAGVYVGGGYKAHVYQKISGSLTLVGEMASNTTLYFLQGGNFVVVTYPA